LANHQLLAQFTRQKDKFEFRNGSLVTSSCLLVLDWWLVGSWVLVRVLLLALDTPVVYVSSNYSLFIE